MGIFGFTREKRADDNATTSSDDLVDDLVLTTLLRGEDVTPTSAMSIPAVASAVNRIAGLASMLPVKLYKSVPVDADGKEIELNDKGEPKKVDGENGEKVTPVIARHKLVEQTADKRVFMLNVDSGDTLNQHSIKREMIKDYLLDKGGFLYIAHNGQQKVGEPTGLRYVPPAKITAVINDVDPFNKAGQYLVNGLHKEQFEFIAMLHDTDDGFLGVPRTKQITDTLQTALSSILYEQGIVLKGGSKKGFLQSDKNLSEPAMQALKRAWRDLYSNKNENVVVLNSGIKFQEANDNAREMQISERKKSLHDELMEIFGIHNDEFDDIFRDAVAPVLEAFEAALNKSLLSEDEKATSYFKFDTTQVLKASLEARYKAYEIASKIGVITKNEIRQSESLEPIDGLDIVSMNLSDILFDTKTKQFFTPNTGKTKEFDGKTDDENEEETE